MIGGILNLNSIPHPGWMWGELPFYLLLASVAGNMEVKRRAAPHVKESIMEPDFEAPIRDNDLPKLNQLIEQGADVNSRCNEGWTPLMYASRYCSNLEIVQLLIEKGAEVNARHEGDLTPLMMAAWASSTPEIIRLLLEKGAEVNVRSFYGDTPLMFAAMYSTYEIVTLLIVKGADVNHRSDSGETPILWCYTNSKGKSAEIRQLLIDAGATE